MDQCIPANTYNKIVSGNQKAADDDPMDESPITVANLYLWIFRRLRKLHPRFCRPSIDVQGPKRSADRRHFLISIIRLSAKGTDGVMKRRCFRLKLMFAILFTGVLGILQRPWR